MAVTVRDPAWFGAVLRQALALRGHATQADLATASGLSLNSVVNLVTGTREAYRLATLEHLATGLGVPVSRLVACATGPSRRPARQVATELLAAPPRRGQSAFLVTAEGIDASVVEAALGAALASLASTRAGAHVSMRPVD